MRKKSFFSKIKDMVSSSSAALYSATSSPLGGLNQGGIHNSASGLGYANDKGRQSFFLPTWASSRMEFETIYNESWAAKKFINITVEDMLQKPRDFVENDVDSINEYKKYLEYFAINQKLENALKLGKLMGTSLLLFVTSEAPLTDKLDINKLLPGDLKNILVVDRYDVIVQDRCLDPFDKNYNKPQIYEVTTRWGGSFQIHASRTIRIDGQQSLSSNNWSTYDTDFGVSELIPIIQSIYQESQLSNGMSQLVEEANIPVIKIDGWKDALKGAPDVASLQEMAQAVNQSKSIYNTMYMDKEDTFERKEVTFSGLSDVYDRFAKRLAAAAGIPATRFWGQSPLGMNATGDADLKNYALLIAAEQERKLRPLYNFIDKIMKKTSGLDFEFTFTFPSLLDISENEMADIAVKKMQVASAGLASGMLTEDEARKIIAGGEIIGELSEDFDGDLNGDFSFDLDSYQQLETPNLKTSI